jgi:uncharacterized surface protein with fasciclin (FAS1) repeats
MYVQDITWTSSKVKRTTNGEQTMTRKLAVAMLAVTMASSAVAGDKGTTRAGKDIVETAVAAGSFKTLAKALEAAGLVDTLKGEGPFTVFAPTDEAFAKLPPGALDALVADKEKLRSVLLYHVVPGSVTASEIVKLTPRRRRRARPSPSTPAKA